MESKRKKVAIFRFCNIGGIPDAAGSQNLSIEAAGWSADPDLSDRIDSIVHVPCDLSDRLPLDIARSQAVKFCYDQDVDIAFFLNGNVIPPAGFFKKAFLLIACKMNADDYVEKDVATAVAAPCLTSFETTNVFKHRAGPEASNWTTSLETVLPEEAIDKVGLEKAPCVGAQCIAYDVNIFNQLAQPCFTYGCDIENYSMVYTDDVNCHRQMAENGQSFLVDWDNWAVYVAYTRFDKSKFEVIEN